MWEELFGGKFSIQRISKTLLNALKFTEVDFNNANREKFLEKLPITKRIILEMKYFSTEEGAKTKSLAAYVLNFTCLKGIKNSNVDIKTTWRVAKREPVEVGVDADLSNIIKSISGVIKVKPSNKISIKNIINI